MEAANAAYSADFSANMAHELDLFDHMFENGDTNGDGELSREELVVMLHSGDEGAHAESELDQLIESNDEDESGTLNRQEFEHAMARVMQSQELDNEEHHVFNEMDTDNNGSVSVDELIAWDNRHGTDKTNTELEADHASADTNGDGEVDFSEFKAKADENAPSHD